MELTNLDVTDTDYEIIPADTLSFVLTSGLDTFGRKKVFLYVNSRFNGIYPDVEMAVDRITFIYGIDVNIINLTK